MKFQFSGEVEVPDLDALDVDATRVRIADGLHQGVKDAWPRTFLRMKISVPPPEPAPEPLLTTPAAGLVS